MQYPRARKLVHLAQENGRLSACLLDNGEHLGINLVGKESLHQGMLLYFRNAQPFARAQVEDPSEEVLQMLVSLQWRRVEVSMLDLPAEFEPLATFQFKLLFK